MPRILLFNKPFAVLSQFTSEPPHRVLAEYIDHKGFYPAGRLDKDSEGLLILTDDGKLQQFIPVPTDMITNCAFGDDDLKTLYITAGHKLWSIRTRATGHVIWPIPNAKP